MRAYVFWHQLRDDVAETEYITAQRDFHSALAQNAPSGFLRSFSFQLPGTPWLEPGTAFEDWYIVVDSAALDALEADAVQGEMTKPHAAAAALTRFGVAGLYKPLGSGDPFLTAPSAVWFDKPAGLPYGTMLSRLRTNDPSILDRLWQRMLTLAPTPEFCLLGGGRDFLPHDWKSLTLVRRPIYNDNW